MRRTLVNEVDARILPALKFWFVAENHKNKFSDGASASYAMDSSVNGNNLGSAGAAPTFRLNDCNGHASFYFNGAVNLSGLNIFTANIRGGFVVVKHNVAGNWEATYPGFISDTGSSTARIIGNAGTQDIHNNGGVDTVYVNGVQTVSVANTDAWNLIYVEFGVAGTFNGTILGRYGGTAGYLNGRIAEAGLFGAIPSAQTRTLFFESMMNKYALTGNV